MYVKPAGPTKGPKQGAKIRGPDPNNIYEHWTIIFDKVKFYPEESDQTKVRNETPKGTPKGMIRNMMMGQRRPRSTKKLLIQSEMRWFLIEAAGCWPRVGRKANHDAQVAGR